jgi:DNA-binding NarL/FixJ family response regulator
MTAKDTREPPMKLMIVEDSTPLRERLGRFFGAVPALDVETAADVASAMGRLQGAAVDVVILDIGLPDGNGIDVLKCIKRTAPATRVLMYTHHAFCRAVCLAAGADGFFDKAGDFEALAAAVAALAGIHDTEDNHD